MSMVPHYSGNRRHGNAVFDPFSMDIWDPFRDGFNHHQLAMPRFDHHQLSRDIVNTCIDWRETADAHIFKADLPGLKKEEVKVEVEEDRVLQISGERSREVEENSDRWHNVERSSGKFIRRFRLPEHVKMDQIKAVMEHGVLTVTVPKETSKKRDIKAIEISG